jgi:hypothetical protein
MAGLVVNSTLCLASALVVAWKFLAPKSATAPSAGTLQETLTKLTHKKESINQRKKIKFLENGS